MQSKALCRLVLAALGLSGCARQETAVERAVPQPPSGAERRLEQVPEHGEAPLPGWRAPLPYGDCYAGQPGGPAALGVRTLPKHCFTIGYSDARRNPLWACYRLGKAVDFTTHARKRFATDRETEARVTHDHYTNSGLSRGHMAPKFAMGSRHGRAGSDSTFVMSNVCPQYQSFNDGQWGDLEECIAGCRVGEQFLCGWADVYETVWVVVGPIFDAPRSPLPSGVEVPCAFYCIVVDEDGDRPRMLAFIMEHVDARVRDLRGFLCCVDAIESRTGLDFFGELPDALEELLEAQIATELWAAPALN